MVATLHWNLAGQLYVLESIDIYEPKYQVVTDEQQLHDWFHQQTNVILPAQGRPGYFLYSKKLANASNPIPYNIRAIVQSSLGAYMANPKVLPCFYCWPFPNDSDANVAKQATDFWALINKYGGWVDGTGCQLDTEQAGMTKHMVAVWTDAFEQLSQRPVLQYGLTTRQPIWDARYRCAPDWHNWVPSIQLTVDQLGFIPTLEQWGGGKNGVFVPGINHGQSRTDSSVVTGNWQAVLAACFPKQPPITYPSQPFTLSEDSMSDGLVRIKGYTNQFAYPSYSPIAPDQVKGYADKGVYAQVIMDHLPTVQVICRRNRMIPSDWFVQVGETVPADILQYVASLPDKS